MARTWCGMTKDGRRVLGDMDTHLKYMKVIDTKENEDMKKFNKRLNHNSFKETIVGKLKNRLNFKFDSKGKVVRR